MITEQLDAAVTGGDQAGLAAAHELRCVGRDTRRVARVLRNRLDGTH
ncbi:hypothetical protein [Streptomyces sp. NPDC021224]